MQRPAGVTAVASAFSLAAAYLLSVGLAMLIRPGLLSMAAGAFLLNGLETAGPFMFLLAAAFAVLIGYGLLQLNNWARRAAAALALLGIVLAIPAVSSSMVDMRATALVWGGLGIMVRAMVVWYLWQGPVREVFAG